MKAGKKSWAAGLALAMTFAAGIGCQQGGGDQWVAVAPGSATGQGDVSLYRDVLFDDIPIPPEYRLMSDISHSFQGSQIRSGVFHYQGQVEWTWALEYFRTQLPQLGWTLQSVDRGFSFRTLRFAKGPERLIMVVRQIRNGSEIELQLDNIEQNDLLLKGKLPSK